MCRYNIIIGAGQGISCEAIRQRSIPSNSFGRMKRGVEFLDEFLQLLGVDVADSEEFETLRSSSVGC